MTSSIAGVGGSVPQAVSGASKRMPMNQKMSQLFSQISGGSGTLTKAQFTAAFNQMNPPASLKAMGADAIFNQLDPNGTGQVSQQDFVNGMKSILSQARGSHGDGASSLRQSLQSLQSALSNQSTAGGSDYTTGSIINITA